MCCRTTVLFDLLPKWTYPGSHGTILQSPVRLKINGIGMCILQRRNICTLRASRLKVKSQGHSHAWRNSISPKESRAEGVRHKKVWSYGCRDVSQNLHGDYSPDNVKFLYSKHRCCPKCEVNNKQYSLTRFFPWHFPEFWSMPCHFADSCQISWHFWVFQLFQVFQVSCHPKLSGQRKKWGV